jgi:DNA processing protein
MIRPRIRDGARLLGPSDREWPASTPPDIVRLWVRGAGRLDVLAVRIVTVAGTRAATPYGELVAHDLAAGLADAGWTVATTGTLGIGGAATRGALSAGGSVLVLPAGGPAAPLPLAHRVLFDRAAAAGALVSTSDRPPDDGRDLIVRGRLLAAWSTAAVLVEPGHRGESRAIAWLARDTGVPLLAAPGPVTSAESAYAHALIRTGSARLVTGAAHVLADLNGGDRVPAEHQS